MKLTQNFYLSEFNCNDGTPVPQEHVHNAAMVAANLQRLRDFLGVPIHINSGYRTHEWNDYVGGVKNSAHLTASAADIVVKTMTPKEVHRAIETLIKRKEMQDGGLGLYAGFVHYDIYRPRRW